MAKQKKQIEAKTFRIRRDDRCFIYEKWNDNPGINNKTGELGEPGWDLVGYYGKLRDVAVYLINSQVKVPAKGFGNAAEVLAAIKELEVNLTAQLEALAME